MQQHTQERNKRKIIERIQEQLNDLIEEDVLIVVEGKKDKEALIALGAANIYSLDRVPLYKAVEQIAKRSRNCALLVDLDAEGKKIYSRLNSDLLQHGVKINNHLRNYLFKETPIRQIEGLLSFCASSFNNL